MFKIYKWLVCIIIRPYKKLQHFRNWFAILFSRTKTNTEKEIRKRKRSYLSYLWAQLAEVAQPRGKGVFHLVPRRVLPPWRACRRRLDHLLPPRVPFSRPGDAQLRPDPFPLLAPRIPFSITRFRSRPKTSSPATVSNRGHHALGTPPPCPEAPQKRSPSSGARNRARYPPEATLASPDAAGCSGTPASNTASFEHPRPHYHLHHVPGEQALETPNLPLRLRLLAILALEAEARIRHGRRGACSGDPLSTPRCPPCS